LVIHDSLSFPQDREISRSFLEACQLYRLNLMKGKSHRDRSSIPIGVRFPYEGRVQVLEERIKNRLTYFETHEASKEFLRKLKRSLI
jgi:hypothetical protein